MYSCFKLVLVVSMCLGVFGANGHRFGFMFFPVTPQYQMRNGEPFTDEPEIHKNVFGQRKNDPISSSCVYVSFCISSIGWLLVISSSVFVVWVEEIRLILPSFVLPKPPKMTKMALDWIKQPLGIFKLISLALSVVALGLYFEYPLSRNEDIYRMTIITIPSNCMVLAYFIISYTFDQGKPGKNFLTEIIFDLVHAVLNVIIGGFAVDSCDSCDGLKSFGAITIILAALLLVDAFFLFRKRE
uniref:MARVEL domain-containing protein n=1 Tax=Strigamia maritima TaxID=126957 RepID=T1IX86_STRMM